MTANRPEPLPHALGYPCPRPGACDRPECLEETDMLRPSAMPHDYDPAEIGGPCDADALR